MNMNGTAGVVRARVDAEMGNLQRFQSEASYMPSPPGHGKAAPMPTPGIQYVRSIEDAMCIHSGWLSPRLEGKFLSSVWEKRYGKVLATSDPRLLTLLLFETEGSKEPRAHLVVDLDMAEFDVGSGMSRKSHRFEIKARLPTEDRTASHRFEFAVDSRKALNGWAAVFEGRSRGRSLDSSMESSSDNCSSTAEFSSSEFSGIDGFSGRPQSSTATTNSTSSINLTPPQYRAPMSPSMHSSYNSSTGSDPRSTGTGSGQWASNAARQGAPNKQTSGGLRVCIGSDGYQSMAPPAYSAASQEAMQMRRGMPMPRTMLAGPSPMPNNASLGVNPRLAHQESMPPMRPRPISNKVISVRNNDAYNAEDAVNVPMLEDPSPPPVQQPAARRAPPTKYADQLAQLTQLCEQAQRIQVPKAPSANTSIRSPTPAPVARSPPPPAPTENSIEEEQLKLMKALMETFAKAQISGNGTAGDHSHQNDAAPRECVYHAPGIPCGNRVMCLECIQRMMRKTQHCPLCNHDVSTTARMYS